MSTVPPTGEARAQLLSDYCDAEGFRLDECVAYADSSSDLPLFEAVGFPVAVNPETRLATSPASAAGSSRTGRRPRAPRSRCSRSVQLLSRARAFRPIPSPSFRHDVIAQRRGGPMKALQIRRQAAKFGMARIASAVAPATAAQIGPLELRTIDDPECPGDGWHRVHTRLAGICGSDLSLVEGHASTYFEDYVSFPFVPGHEVVGELDDGTRVILEPVLGHAARGVAPRSTVPRRATATTTPTSRRARPTAPRARHPDRVLLLDRRRLGPVVLGPRVAAAPHRRRHARRACRAGRAARRRHPCRAAGLAVDRRRGATRSSPCSAPARWGSLRSPASSATCPACGSSSAPATRTRWRSPRRSAPTSSCRPRSSTGRFAARPAAT